MSQISYAWDQAPVEELVIPSGTPWVEPPKRSIWQPFLVGVPLLFATGGYFLGTTALTDAAFLFLTVLFAVFLLGDLSRFSERYGLGGVILFGGVLTWFCYDYFQHWFLAWMTHWKMPIAEQAVAKGGMYHILYILCLTVGIRFNFGRWVSKLITRLPEPPDPSNYFYIVLITQLIGLSPYFFFTREPFYLAVWHEMTAGRNGRGTQWIAGRTGNVNFSWAAYIAQMLQVGQGGAVLASFCTVFLRQNIVRNAICAVFWLLWAGMAFGSGTRGEIVVLMLPLCCFIFIRYHVQAQEFLHKYSIRAYIFAGAVLMVSLVLVQTQIHYRTTGFSEINLANVSLTDLQGNSMFSESLMGFAYIPERHDYFYNNYPFQTIVQPIPNFLFWAAVAPMPRALWKTKPIDPSWKWYNAVATGRSTIGGGQVEGTTISQGIVGYWYFRFGLPGIIEGGLFMGWLLGRVERALYNNGGRPMAFFAALALLTWLFRTYREADFQDLADTLVVLTALVFCTFTLRPFLRSNRQLSPA